MLYKIDNKFYILVQGYYKEVDIKVNSDALDIKPNGNEIEKTKVSEFEMFDMRSQTPKVIEIIKNNEFEREQEIFNSSISNDRRVRQTNARKRM